MTASAADEADDVLGLGEDRVGDGVSAACALAEDNHQHYLAKNPQGYFGLGGTGVSCPIGTGVASGF